ncbi:M-phase-specific PLK1-interacting protein [Melanotaenia boesemani]|uniref:M-phase-specific PLK1-interacting protein n=1 Tax=Melanotaenia boesemani TaxID=1250792 RepID=UPI001C0486B7|nr:M-phase-specific PLK1-interacting protein [Melanotaenia boesemani]
MQRPPVRSQRSPGAPRPPGRFPSPSPCWPFPGPRSPFIDSGHRGGSPRGGQPYAPGPPVFSPSSNRGFGNRSPGGFGSGSRDFAGQMRRRGGVSRQLPSFSPSSSPNFQSRHSDPPVEKFFSPSMMDDPWKTLHPLTAKDATAAKRFT